MSRDALLALADELERAWNGSGPLDLDGFSDRIRTLAAQPDVQSAPKAERVNEYGEPEVIYLQLHGDGYRNETKPSDYQSGEVTWCWHAINNDDVRYIRADLAQHTTPPLPDPHGTAYIFNDLSRRRKQIQELLRAEPGDEPNTTPPCADGETK